MDEDRDREVILAHIQALAAGRHAGAMQLAQRIGRHCWPGGSSDRSEPGALDWVRRWGPRGVAPSQPGCSCKLGRCAVCN
jgi:hypothetical protein